MTALQDATRAQNTAAHPAQTAWVSANAGSGKTRVLTDRVARLLIKKVPPQKILCLTYTKAAAAEMQARLYKRLGEWAMLDDDALRQALCDIGEAGRDFTEDALDNTRTLFARALETPGGLKIQTIHAFCGHLLRRFPLEAGVSPRFREMDTAQAASLQTQVLSDMAAVEPSPLDALAIHLTNEAGLGSLIADILRHREDFTRFERTELARVCGIPVDLTEAEVLAELDQNAPKTTVADIRDAIFRDGTDNERTNKFAGLAVLPDDPRDYLKVLRQHFLNKDGTRPKSPCTKAVLSNNPWIAGAFAEIQDTVLGTDDRLASIAFLQRATDLAYFARDFLARYGHAKDVRAFLDFDDLIDRTRDLLTAYDTTQWVLYRLDGGIEHILVDEAQDTSPRQWEVIETISAGFADQPPGTRTLFIVGDQKQSIFGFQGAEPGQLTDKKEELLDKLQAANQHLNDTPLLYSFRSAAPILQLVDAIFETDPIAALGGPPEHRFFDTKPGRVDVWPFLEKGPAADEGEWWDPVDTDRPDDPVIALADDLARHIRDTVDAATPIPDGNGGWRAATPGDFLILVRSRNRFFHRLIAQLKTQQVPVAGADRLRIKNELAVKDLLSLLRFLDNERDDLSLAEALRSPLFGLSEADLFALAHKRPGLLWGSLNTSDHTTVTEQLRRLRNRVDYDRPYEVLETILTVHSGRQRMVARLGAQCTEAIDELLAQSLAYERSALPTLSGFLAWIDARDVEVKRDMDAAGGEVRVMTIHGAKGLEAPIVVLADTSQRKASNKAPQVQASNGLPFWARAVAETPAALEHVETERRAAEDRETARLLYVALTRAESWLIVCGAGEKPDAPGRWFGQVNSAAELMATGTAPMGGPRIDHIWTPSEVAHPARSTAKTPVIADLRAKPAPFLRQRPISPSQVNAPHSLPGEPDIHATDRGTLIHDLIDTLAPLPADQRVAVGQRMLTGESWESGALDTVLSTLENPDLAHVFDGNALTEVSIAASPDLTRNHAVFGRIDRLIVSPTDVLAIDFKSNRIVPPTAEDTPLGILAQMGIYAAALADIFPDRTIKTAVVWTETGLIMPLPHALVSQAAQVVSIP